MEIIEVLVAAWLHGREDYMVLHMFCLVVMDLVIMDLMINFQGYGLRLLSHIPFLVCNFSILHVDTILELLCM